MLISCFEIFSQEIYSYLHAETVNIKNHFHGNLLFTIYYLKEPFKLRWLRMKEKGKYPLINIMKIPFQVKIGGSRGFCPWELIFFSLSLLFVYTSISCFELFSQEIHSYLRDELDNDIPTLCDRNQDSRDKLLHWAYNDS